MLRIAVCDDEEHLLREFCPCIEKTFLAYDSPALVKGFSSSSEFWQAQLCCSFDMVFLDIDMPEIDGISLGKKLQKSAPDTTILFLSGHEEKVFETFAVSPLRFIRKSHFFDEIEEAVSAFLSLQKKAVKQSLVVSAQGSLISVPVDEILYVECWAKIQNIVTVSRNIEIRSTLKELNSKLDGLGFLQPHKGYLVNYRYISSIREGELVLKNNSRIPISKYRYKDLKKEYLRMVTQSLNV